MTLVTTLVAAAAARRLLAAFDESFVIDGLDLNVEASLGVAVADRGPDGGGDGINVFSSMYDPDGPGPLLCPGRARGRLTR